MRVVNYTSDERENAKSRQKRSTQEVIFLTQMETAASSIGWLIIDVLIPPYPFYGTVFANCTSKVKLIVPQVHFNLYDSIQSDPHLRDGIPTINSKNWNALTKMLQINFV